MTNSIEEWAGETGCKDEIRFIENMDGEIGKILGSYQKIALATIISSFRTFQTSLVHSNPDLARNKVLEARAKLNNFIDKGAIDGSVSD